MYASIATITYDKHGSMLLKIDESESNLYDCSRRISRTKTLDGGATILDNGFYHSDRTITLVIKDATKAEADKLVSPSVKFYLG